MNVHWDIFTFISAQYGTEHPAIGSVLVLTGSAVRAQATTCEEYLRTNWPKTGSIFLQIVEGLLRDAGSEGTKGRSKSSFSISS